MIAPEVVREPCLELGPGRRQPQVGTDGAVLAPGPEPGGAERGRERRAHRRGLQHVGERELVPAALARQGVDQRGRELGLAPALDHEVEEVRPDGAARADELELTEGEPVVAPDLDLTRRRRD